MPFVSPYKANSRSVFFLILIGLVFSVFFCFSMVLHVSLSDSSDGHGMSLAECCIADAAGSFAGHVEGALSSSSNMYMSVSAVAVWALVFSLIYARQDYFRNYLSATRDKYGGFHYFIYLIRLLRQGIIHPKIYEILV